MTRRHFPTPEEQQRALDEARALAAPLSGELQTILDKALANARLWGRGNSNGWRHASLHVLLWVPYPGHPNGLPWRNQAAAVERGREAIESLWQGYGAEAACGRSLYLEGPVDYFSLPRELTDDEKHRIWDRYAAEMVKWVEVDGHTAEICSFCRGWVRDLDLPHEWT